MFRPADDGTLRVYMLYRRFRNSLLFLVSTGLSKQVTSPSETNSFSTTKSTIKYKNETRSIKFCTHRGATSTYLNELTCWLQIRLFNTHLKSLLKGSSLADKIAPCPLGRNLSVALKISRGKRTRQEMSSSGIVS